MADSAKWTYREPEAISGRLPTEQERRREQKLNRLLKATAGSSGSSTGVGSSRRGGSRNVDENMDAPSSRRFNVLDRQGRNVPGTSTRAARDKLPNISVIIDFVHRKYNPAAQFLSLDNIFQDQVLKANGIDRWQLHSNQDKLADAMWKAAGELDPPVRTIDAANNNLTRWQLQRLPQYLPHVQSISLRFNKVETMHDLERFWTRGGKGGMRNLTEMWLIGNPIREAAEKHGLDEYYYNMQSFIRTLKVVDGVPITNVLWDVSEPTVPERWPASIQYAPTFPVPMSSSSYDPQLQGMLTNVLSTLFSLYDSNRKALVNAYAPEATFSFNPIANTPPRHSAAPYKAPAGVSVPTADTMKNLQMLSSAPSRNLKVMPQAAVRLDTLFYGPAAILGAFEALPATYHPLQDGSKFVFDATLLPDAGSGEMLAVTVHGEFTAVEIGQVFSFSRAFLFVPAPEGSSAQQIGMNVFVLSDILTLKRPSPSVAWVPGPIITQEESYARGGRPPRNNGKATAATASAAQVATMAIDAPPAQPSVPIFQQQTGIAQPQQPQQPMQQFQPQMPSQFPEQQQQQQQQVQAVPQQMQPQQQSQMSMMQAQPVQQQPMQQQPMQQPAPVQQPTPVPPQITPIQVAPTPPQPAPDAGGQVQLRFPDGWDSLPEDHRNMAIFFSHQTNLQPGAACSLLEVNNWDASVTYQQFMAVKDGIPPEFWINPPGS